MKYKKLGNTDLEVSEICLGTMTWGEQNTEAEGHAQIDYALDQGINFMDTAELYSVPARPETQGSTETIIGNWFEKNGKRSNWILASKVAGPSSFTQHIRKDRDLTKEIIHTALSGSLKRLKTDYIDLYQIHWPARRTNFFGSRGYTKHDDRWEDNFFELASTMHELIQSGKIRHWGLSNETPWGLTRYLHLCEVNGLVKPVSVQNPYNLLNRLYEVGMAEISIREKCGLLAYSPLGMGMLSGKYHKANVSKSARLILFSKNYPRYLGEINMQATKAYMDIAKSQGISTTQLALAFVNQQQFLTSNIIGATSLDQLKENISSKDIVLSDEVIKQINKIHESMPNPAP